MISSDGITWEYPHPEPTKLNAVTYGNNMFVAVGTEGTVLTSRDGVKWTTGNSGTDEITFKAITYGKDIFVAIGGEYSVNCSFPSMSYGDVIATSSDGETWAVTDFADSLNLISVTYGNGVFVAVGFNGVILTSNDGLSWTKNVNNKELIFSSVVYANGTFFVRGFSSIKEIVIALTSVDGITWSEHSTGTEQVWKITYADNIFVGIGNNAIFTSVDGFTWAKTYFDYDVYFRGIVYGNSSFIAISSGWGNSKILSSTDGIKWIEVYSRDGIDLSDVAYGADSFVVVGNFGTVLQTDKISSTSPQYSVYVENAGNGSGTVSGTGLSCDKNICTGSYDSGTSVELSALADPGSVFAGWSGSGCSGKGNCHFEANTDAVVTATFTKCIYTISPGTKSVAAEGSKGSFKVTTDSGCVWTASSDSDWVFVMSGINGKGSGQVNFSFNSNMSKNSRTGIISVADKTFSIIQQGAADISGSWVQVSKKKSGQKFEVRGKFKVTASYYKAANVNIKIYLSDSSSHSSADIYLGAIRFNNIGAGKSSIKTFSYGKLSSVPKNKYLIAIIDPDDAIVETDKSNNVVVSNQIQ